MEHSANTSGILSNFKRKGTQQLQEEYTLSFEKFGVNKEIFEWAWPLCTHRRSLWVGNQLKSFVMGPSIVVSCYLKKIFTKKFMAKSKLAISSRKPSVTANFSAKICYNLPYTYPMGKKLSEQLYKAIFNTICDFQEVWERSIFLTKLGTFGKMEPNFVTLGNFNNDHARNVKICTQISVVEGIQNMQ